MSEGEDKDAKQFDPSEQKLQKAREEGDVPRSVEVSALMAYAGLALAFALSGGFVQEWLRLVTHFDADSYHGFDAGKAIGMRAAVLLVGFLMVPALLVLGGLVLQRGLTLSGKKLRPDLKRIDPIKNFKQKFGKSGLVSFGISLLKFGFVGLGGALLFQLLFGRLLTTSMMVEQQWVAGLGLMLRQSLGLAIGLSGFLAVIDFFWKRHDHLTRNRMSLKEMRDEHKDSEGDPHFKQARRQRAVDIITAQMVADTRKADVIIVNPTHYAVALEWKRGDQSAPVCLAKGVDGAALRIREVAKEHGVPIWSDPPCARALHSQMEIGDQIPVEQFVAVAAAIRFSEAMRKKARSAGW